MFQPVFLYVIDKGCFVCSLTFGFRQTILGSKLFTQMSFLPSEPATDQTSTSMLINQPCSPNVLKDVKGKLSQIFESNSMLNECFELGQRASRILFRKQHLNIRFHPSVIKGKMIGLHRTFELP